MSPFCPELRGDQIGRGQASDMDFWLRGLSDEAAGLQRPPPDRLVPGGAVVGGLRLVAWDDLRTGELIKQGFRHLPNSPASVGWVSEALPIAFVPHQIDELRCADPSYIFLAILPTTALWNRTAETGQSAFGQVWP